MIVLNADWFFLSHRLEHAIKAAENGYKVVVAAGDTGMSDQIRSLGFVYYPLKLDRSGKNLMKEFATFLQLARIYRNIQPDIVHHFTWKPILYGTFAGRLAGIQQIVNTVTGFGYLFIKRHGRTQLLRRFLVMVLKILLRSKRVKIIVQNSYDLETFLRWNIVPVSHLTKINGAGVNLKVFKYVDEQDSASVRVALPARMIADKGIWDFVEAARILKKEFGEKVEFLLAGDVDRQNISSLTEEELKALNQENNIKWLGFVYDMPTFIAGCHIIVLPSYREGLPKVLLESLAIGRCIITTDVPGCRDVVTHGEEGLLVPPNDPTSLSTALRFLIENFEIRTKMGRSGRKKAERCFDVNIVVEQILNFYKL